MSLDLFVFPSNIHNFEMHYNFTHLQFIEIDYNIFPTLEVSLTQQNEKQTIVTDCMCRCHNQFNNLTSPTSDFPIDPSTHTTWSPFCHQIMEPSLHKVEILREMLEDCQYECIIPKYLSTIELFNMFMVYIDTI